MDLMYIYIYICVCTYIHSYTHTYIHTRPKMDWTFNAILYFTKFFILVWGFVDYFKVSKSLFCPHGRFEGSLARLTQRLNQRERSAGEEDGSTTSLSATNDSSRQRSISFDWWVSWEYWTAFDMWPNCYYWNESFMNIVSIISFMLMFFVFFY